MLRAVRPLQVIMPDREPHLQHALGEARLSPYQGQWKALVTDRRVDDLWSF